MCWESPEGWSVGGNWKLLKEKGGSDESSTGAEPLGWV